MTTHPSYPFLAQWRGPFRGWGVFYMHVRDGRGRMVALFKGKFAAYRAQKRAERLSHKWIQEHMPKSVLVPRVTQNVPARRVSKGEAI
jgi:hypothetical protein